MIKAWLTAFRLRTLPLAVSSVGMGGFLAYSTGVFNWNTMLLTVATTIFLQILSNLANDYGDSIHGADNVNREGPSRTVQSGVITKSQMRNAIITFGLLSLLSGLALLYVSLGWNLESFLFFFGLGILCIVAAITYTVGRKPYGYAGLGDISVLLFFGFTGVLGSYYLFSNRIEFIMILPALTCGLFSVAVLNINNTRDIESDRSAGKYSIPVRIGPRKAKVYHWVLLLSGMLSISVYAGLVFSEWHQWMFIVSFPLFFMNGIRLWKAESSRDMDPLLKQLAISTLVFVILFGVGAGLQV